ncbi:MAG: FMN-binding protein [Verrucomicrobiaceae bacterium]|nr:FMN-binding protein [Verrucomicrobiaceae bacterium]
MKTLSILLFLTVVVVSRADTIELISGAKVEGKVLANDAAAKTLTVEFLLSGKLTQRTVPYATVRAITVGGVRSMIGAAAAVAATPTTRTPAEVKAFISSVGPSEPDWLKSTGLNLPKTLDLSWPEKPPQGWNNQKNVGQFIWDIINPNTNRWKEGVKLMHDLLATKPDAALKARATKELANMHFRFFQDYARAAWWWQQAEITANDPPGIHLAECYWRLGSKQMALDFIGRSQYLTLNAIKLLGDMQETDRALEMADEYNDPDAWLLAGDACRLAGRIPQAKALYEKVVSTPPPAGQKPDRLKRTQNRAQASLEALRLYELSDVSKVADGTYKDSSLGYEGQVEVSVKVSGKKIEGVQITQHKEKQYYSSMRDVPEQIIAKQGVKQVDATSRATITSEAIINAVSKALAQERNEGR